jgi:16S rRNA (adenine1518-N6/adenine1519-N6)-dimethyltransferase
MTADARALLARHGLRAKKTWGQSFLVDEGVRDRIVEAARIDRADVVVEIGAGLGAMTGALAARAGRVIAIERDPDLVGVLRRELAGAGNVEVVAGDALGFDLRAAARAAGRPLVVVGNLPYQITSPLVFRIIEAAGRGETVGRAIVMVQREVADRMAAPAGGKTYGRLSVMVQQAARVAALFDVGRRSFHPQPSVTSTVLRLEPRRAPLAPVEDERCFALAVRAAFGARRKMLRRALAQVFGDAVAAGALVAAGVAGERRAEELAVADFARLADALAARRAAWPRGALAAASAAAAGADDALGEGGDA